MIEIPEEMKQVIDVEREKDKRVIKLELATKKKTILLAIIASYVPLKVSPSEVEFAALGISEEFGIETVLSQIAETAPKNDFPAFLLVNSQGGAMPSSYKSAKALRDSFKNISVFVPHVALSGGTLLALTGNRIVMGKMSHLSPLDVQLQYKGTTVSANDLLRCKGRLDDYFKDKEVESVPYSWKTLADQLDGTLIENVLSAQRTACEYITEILKKSGYKNAKNLARKLVYDLPSHGFVIDYERAKKLGLRVVPYATDTETWQIMRYWLAKYFVKATDRHFIRYVVPQVKI